MKTKASKPLFKTFMAIVLLVLFQLLAGFAFAQNGTIRGAVYEESTGEPLFGVSVLVKNSLPVPSRILTGSLKSR